MMSLQKDRAELTIVVCSCDAYSDLWRPFFTLFFRNWPDCPWTVALMSNECRYDDSRVQTLAVGQLQSWSRELKAVLERVTTSHVLLILDDFFLRSPVNQELVDACFKGLVACDGNMLRLLPRPGPDRNVAGTKLFGSIDSGASYRVSAQASIWRKSALEHLLRDDESIWQFEAHGSRRSDAKDGYYAVWRDAITYGHHVVERGKWFRHEARHFDSMNIGCDFSRRPIMSHSEMLRWHCHRFVGLAYSTVPWRWRRTLGEILRGGRKF